MQLRNLFRRHKWRLRPLKRLVLPARRAKRLVVQLFRRPPIIETAPNYRGPSFYAVSEIYPAAKVTVPVPPFGDRGPIADGTSKPAAIYEFRDIQFWGRYGGSIVTSDHRLLADFSPEVWGAENHPLFSQIKLPALKELSGKTAIAVTPEAVGNYYHWLIDLLPRAALLQFSEREFDRLLINGARADYEQASLDALQIPREKIAYVDSGDRLHLEKANVPSMDHTSKTIAPWKIETLRRIRDAVAPEQNLPRRIYVSRRGAAVRRVLNESDLEIVLRRSGFAIVELDSRPWNQQIALFRSAEVILAPHGAALANIAFCEPGITVAEITTKAGYKDFYLQLAAAANLRYHSIEARPRVATDTTSLRAVENEDVIVEPGAVEDFIEKL